MTPASRLPGEKDFTKRRSVEAGVALADAAHRATWRLYSDVFRLWRGCALPRCRHHRRCSGEPARCLLRALPSIAIERQIAAASEVANGGPRRLAPANHLEWQVRREPLPTLAAWPAAPARPR